MPFKSLQELFIHELSELYSADRQLSKALPRLLHATDDGQLSEALDLHMLELGNHLERIEHVMESLDVRPRRGKCAAIETLLEDLRDIVDVVPQGSLRDVALLAGLQKMTRYQSAAHAVIITLARKLDYRDVLPSLTCNLDEKNAADARFARLAGHGPQQAAQAA